MTIRERRFMFNIISINSIPECTISRKEHIKCIDYQDKIAEEFVQSVNKLNGNYTVFDNLNCGAELPDTIPFASNPKWKDLPFGAANTCGNASCGALQSAVIINYFNSIATESAKLFFDFTPSVLSIIDVLVKKGYRSWKLEHKIGTMSAPVATLGVIKEHFPEDKDIQACTSLDEVFYKFGNPSGIGTNLFWLDNIIKLFSFENVEITKDTRINSVGKIIQNLSRGIVVPIRVENSVYLGDNTHHGGHYVTWFAVKNGKALIVDTAMEKNCGIYKIPVSQVFNSIINNPKMAIVWDIEPAVKTISTLSISEHFFS